MLAWIGFDVAATTMAGRAAWQQRQQARWVALLRVAGAGSALHRRALAGRDPARTPLSSMPITVKAELMAQFSDWVTDPRLDLASLRAFVADPRRIGEPWLDDYAVWESSGSQGEPALFVHDAQALAVYDALEATRRSSPRPLQRWFDPFYLGERVAFVGAIDGHFASEVSMRRLRRSQPWRASTWRSFSIQQPAAALVAELDAFAPTVIATYPTAALLLSEEADAGRLRTRPREVWTGGEWLSATARHRIEGSLGCTLRNSYGASEFLPIAWECDKGRLHVNADWVILEPVDEDGRPTAAGQASHTTLLTNLANHVQPIIRLDIGDRLTMHATPCRCGCALPTLEIEGRCDDMLGLAGANGQRITVLPLALVSALEDRAGVSAFHLQQTGPRSLRLSLDARSDGHDAARCRQALREFATMQGLAPLRIELKRVAELPIGRSGKRARIEALRPWARTARGRATPC